MIHTCFCQFALTMQCQSECAQDTAAKCLYSSRSLRTTTGEDETHLRGSNSWKELRDFWQDTSQIATSASCPTMAWAYAQAKLLGQVQWAIKWLKMPYCHDPCWVRGSEDEGRLARVHSYMGVASSVLHACIESSIVHSPKFYFKRISHFHDIISVSRHSS